MTKALRGIYAAVVTPFDDERKVSEEQLHACLHHLASNGCHGVLLAGTTGEGPSLSVDERLALFRAAQKADSGLRLLAGTGAASIEDTKTLTRAAFDIGLDGVVIIPPFFFIDAPEAGVFQAFSDVIDSSVPGDGIVLLYHNPGACGIGLSHNLIRHLRDSFPGQVVGIKDSSQNWEHTEKILADIPGFTVFTGDDRSLANTLSHGGAGSITLIANIFANRDRTVFDAFESRLDLSKPQQILSDTHNLLAGIPRIPAVKAQLKYSHVIANDSVRPPLRPLNEQEIALLRERLESDATLSG